MAKSITVNQKKRGRPATGRDPVSAVRIPDELGAAIDAWAKRNAAGTRSQAIRQLLEQALAAQTAKAKGRK